MSFHCAFIKGRAAYVLSDMAVHGQPNASKQYKNDGAIVSAVGSGKFGKFYAEWALNVPAQVDYGGEGFLAASEGVGRRTWAESFAPFVEQPHGAVVHIILAARAGDGLPVLISISHLRGDDFQHQVFRTEGSFVAPWPEEGEAAVVNRALFPLLTSPLDGEDFRLALQERAALFFRELHKVNPLVTVEHEISRVEAI